MVRSFFLLLAVSLAIPFAMLAQSDIQALANQGDIYYSNARYKKALSTFEEVFQLDPANNKNKLSLARCYAMLGNPDQAEKYLNYVLENDDKLKIEALYDLAHVLHLDNQFKQAISTYKQFLKYSSPEDIRRQAVKMNLLRCSNGMKSRTTNNIIVENFGEAINSEGSEFHPVPNPNDANRIYYSSTRENNIGGLRNQIGEQDPNGFNTSDIFYTDREDGRWRKAILHSNSINNAQYNVLHDFNNDGGILFHTQGYTQHSGDFLAIDFNSGEGKPYQLNFSGQIKPHQGDNDFFFYNDSLLLFSGYRPAGFGALDLYYIQLNSDGIWSIPQNLGPSINTAYDERDPYLSLDGRTLYFSSNSINSYGGYDILKSTYDDDLRQWVPAVNVHQPINSGANDRHFRISPDGLKAYFSSNRMGGYGAEDLYVAYFNNPLPESQLISNPITFVDLEPMPGIDDVKPFAIIEQLQKQEVKLEPFYFENGQTIYNPLNQEKITRLGQMLTQNPEQHILIIGHSDSQQAAEVEMFFNIKKMEELAEKLTDSGIEKHRIHIQSVGSHYPILKPEFIKSSPGSQKFFRRGDVFLFQDLYTRIPIDQNLPAVNPVLIDPRNTFYNQMLSGLSYRVELAVVPGLLENEILFTYPHPMMELLPETNEYRYTVGWYRTFSSSYELMNEVIKTGNEDVKIVAYFNGLPLNPNDASSIVDQYPDLSNFLKTNQ